MTGDFPDGVGRQLVDEISQKQRNRQILEKSAKLDFVYFSASMKMTDVG